MVANSAADNGMRSLPSHGAATPSAATASRTLTTIRPTCTETRPENRDALIATATAPYATANAIRSPSSWRITLGRLASHRRSATAPLITAAARLVITGRRQDVRKAGLRGSA